VLLEVVLLGMFLAEMCRRMLCLQQAKHMGLSR